MKEWAKSFYKGRPWQRCRWSYIQERIGVDGGMCEECHKQVAYIVHHTEILTPDNIGIPEVSLNHELLKYVCKECHDEYDGHGLKKKNELLCEFDELGQPISKRECDIAPLVY